MTRRSSRNGTHGGFSLLEVLLALAIIMTCASVLFVDYSGATANERLKSAARRIAGSLGQARSTAVTRRLPVRFQVEFDKQQYRFVPDPPRSPWLEYVDPETGAIMTERDIAEWDESYPWEDLPSNIFFSDMAISPKEVFDKGPVTVNFHPDGTVDPFVLHLKTTENTWASITMNGLTGMATADVGNLGFAAATQTDFNSVMANKAPGTGTTGNRQSASEGASASGSGNKTPSTGAGGTNTQSGGSGRPAPRTGRGG